MLPQITTLAVYGIRNELELYEALTGIIVRMEGSIEQIGA